jgi:hypothetical protein
VRTDRATYVQALEDLGDGWELHSYGRHHSAMQGYCRILLPTIDVRAYLSGLEMWNGATFSVTAAGHEALAMSSVEDLDDA